jgi:UDP-N-acetylmuramate--alanine ligase
MCSLAETLQFSGYKVMGSDFKESETVTRLRQEGIQVFVGHNAANVEQADYIIRSAAIHDDNPEVVRARQRGIPVFERAEGWGALMQGYQKAICVAGTHGKTSTTSMLSHIALASDVDPTIMLGGNLTAIGGGHRVGVKREMILLESCEYCNSFLHFRPTTAVVLNVEADHLDFFKDLDDVKNSFRQFAMLVPKENGLVVYNADDEGAVDCLKDLPRKTVTFGIESQADYMAKNIVYDKGNCSFDVYKKGSLLFKAKLLVPGRHNVLNALASIAAAAENGLNPQEIALGLSSYPGVGRRFEFKGEFGGALVYDDYAHHPAEISALFDAVNDMGFERIIAVFQPHTYTRTIAFFDEFIQVLSRPDLLILADIFAAREQNTTGLSSADLSVKIDGSYFIPDFNDIVEFLKRTARPGDCILTIGAGELNQVAEHLVKQAETTVKRPNPFEYGVEEGGLREIGKIKILVCYLLNAVGGEMPRHLLDQSLQSDGLCSYWGISAAISQLIENGMIEERCQMDIIGYRITKEGKACAEELETSLPLVVRERAISRAAALLAKVRAADENIISIDKTPDGYVVSCTIPDRNSELMTVRLGVSDSMQANLIKDRFLEDPSKIYKKVLAAFGIE